MLGWLTVIGWQANFAATAYLCGSNIQALIALSNPNYVPRPWHGTLLTIAVIFGVVLFNIIRSTFLANFEGLLLVLLILGFFAVFIILAYMANHVSAGKVFANFLNLGHWPTTGLATFIGLTGNVFAFLGADSAVHVG